MKYFATIFSAIVLALCFTACGDKEEDTAVVEDTSADVQDSGSDAGEGEGEGEGEGDAGSGDAEAGE